MQKKFLFPQDKQTQLLMSFIVLKSYSYKILEKQLL